MPFEKQSETPSFDYIGSYEKAIRQIIEACGSKQAANQLIGELHDHYEKTDFELKRIKKEFWSDPERHAAEKAKVLAHARFEVADIIERRVPHSGDHIKEIVVGASLAITALMVPITYAFSPLTAAASILSIGGSYYIGFKLLKNWKTISNKEHISSLAGVVGPKHIKGISMTAKITKVKKK